MFQVMAKRLENKSYAEFKLDHQLVGARRAVVPCLESNYASPGKWDAYFTQGAADTVNRDRSILIVYKNICQHRESMLANILKITTLTNEKPVSN